MKLILAITAIIFATNAMAATNRAFVSNERSDTVSVIDILTNKVASQQDSAGKIKALTIELRQSCANLALKQNGGCTTSKNPSSKSLRALYIWEEQYVPGKLFESRKEFFEWLYKKPSSGSKKKKNGLTWHFCSICKRNVRHEPKDCPKKSYNKGQKGARSYAAAMAVIHVHHSDESCVNTEN